MKGSLVVELAGDIVKIEMDALSNRSWARQPAIHATKQGNTGEQRTPDQGINI